VGSHAVAGMAAMGRRCHGRTLFALDVLDALQPRQALLMASVTLLTGNWMIGVSSVAVLALLTIRTPKEEQMLIERFGQDYRDYMETTGRFIPRIGR
jgi:steroid 5-alpha reductase family enzyme